MAKFGKYNSFGDFIAAYEAAQQQEPDLAVAMAMRVKKNPCRTRAIVDVKAVIRVHEPDDNDSNGGRHYRLRITLSEIVTNHDEVKADVQRCLDQNKRVFVAIRFGDSQGVTTAVTGIDVNDAVQLKGEWIPASKARSNGGERVSVLHFTHHPCGFIQTEDGRFQ